MKFLILKRNRGSMLLETLFYISIFVVFSLLVVLTFFNVAASFDAIKINNELINSASIADRITREIRNADSVFGVVEPTDLRLNTVNESDVNVVLRFSLLEDNLQLFENDVFIGNLNSSNINVSNLSFAKINTQKGEAIRFYFTVSSKKNIYKLINLHNTVVLRNTY